VTLYQCPECGRRTATNATTGGAFRVAPTLYCYHVNDDTSDSDVDEAFEMEKVADSDLDTGADNVYSLDRGDLS